MAKSHAWKDFERQIAKTWGSFRTPLSGINSRHGPGDVILPEDVSALLECKTRKASTHWTLFKEAQADAKKNGIDPSRTVLYFKLKGGHGHIVTVDGEFFQELLAVPGVKELFKKKEGP